MVPESTESLLLLPHSTPRTSTRPLRPSLVAWPTSAFPPPCSSPSLWLLAEATSVHPACSPSSPNSSAALTPGPSATGRWERRDSWWRGNSNDSRFIYFSSCPLPARRTCVWLQPLRMQLEEEDPRSLPCPASERGVAAAAPKRLVPAFAATFSGCRWFAVESCNSLVSIRPLPTSVSCSAAGSTTTASTSRASACGRPSKWGWHSRGRLATRFPSCCSSGRAAVTSVDALKRFTLRPWGELCCHRMFERPTPSVHHLRWTHRWKGNEMRFPLPSSYITGRESNGTSYCLYFPPNTMMCTLDKILFGIVVESWHKICLLILFFPNQTRMNLIWGSSLLLV